MRTAIGLVRDREWGVLGAVVWWGFDIATLWACFHAFGPDPPPFAVIVIAYFVGMLGNTLPLPGGIGGVDGGMIGAFVGLRRLLRTTRSSAVVDLSRVRLLAADDPGRDRLLPAAADASRRWRAEHRRPRRRGRGRAGVTDAPTSYYTK